MTTRVVRGNVYKMRDTGAGALVVIKTDAGRKINALLGKGLSPRSVDPRSRGFKLFELSDVKPLNIPIILAIRQD
ncbi:hypothetical protein J4457_05990 [Candidatus Woesearchaeota archaeon]|nr:hypothetical protein [Candidatus Woesearchaeota archaeon]